MDKEYAPMQTETYMKGNGVQIKERVKDPLSIKMAASMKATGKIACEMVKVNTFLKQELFKKEIGWKILL